MAAAVSAAALEVWDAELDALAQRLALLFPCSERTTAAGTRGPPGRLPLCFLQEGRGRSCMGRPPVQHLHATRAGDVDRDWVGDAGPAAGRARRGAGEYPRPEGGVKVAPRCWICMRAASGREGPRDLHLPLPLMKVRFRRLRLPYPCQVTWGVTGDDRGHVSGTAGVRPGGRAPAGGATRDRKPLPNRISLQVFESSFGKLNLLVDRLRGGRGR